MENFGNINALNALAPTNNDLISEGDDHIRGIKDTLKTTFPGFTGSLTPAVSDTFLNDLSK